MNSSSLDKGSISRFGPLVWMVAIVIVLGIGLVIGRAIGQARASTTAEESRTKVKTPTSDSDMTPVQADQAAANSTTSNSQIMTFLLSDVRHFQGDTDAPVVFVEFSDFK